MNVDNGIAMQGLSETQFAALVDALTASPAAHDRLASLLREDHPLYDQRGAAGIVRMRGWILLALARVGLSDKGLLFVLEELDTGHDGYLVAAAARALRSYPTPQAAFAPFVVRAIGNMRHQDDAVAFDAYGAYPSSSEGTTPVLELLATLIWLGPEARQVLPQLEELAAIDSGLTTKLRAAAERAADAIRSVSTPAADSPDASCCSLPASVGHLVRWPFAARASASAIESTLFEDHDGAVLAYADFFHGRPTIVTFFYTRCDNPQKCSLTISKLARVQQQLAERGLADRVRTAAITYDPAFDIADRLRLYGQRRGVRMDANHRLLRTMGGMDVVRTYFSLGVNFIESLVNRHRIEVQVVDARGRIAASFGRIHWREQDVVDCAIELLNEPDTTANERAGLHSGRRETAATSAVGTLASWGIAVFPKCPLCWSAYLSGAGIAGVERIPYSPWLYSVFVALASINLLSAWWRGRSVGRMTGFYLVALGALAIALSKAGAGLENAGLAGVALTLGGSLLGSLTPDRSREASPILLPRAPDGVRN